MWPVEQWRAGRQDWAAGGGASLLARVFCVNPTAERNSIFQGDDV